MRKYILGWIVLDTISQSKNNGTNTNRIMGQIKNGIIEQIQKGRLDQHCLCIVFTCGSDQPRRDWSNSQSPAELSLVEARLAPMRPIGARCLYNLSRQMITFTKRTYIIIRMINIVLERVIFLKNLINMIILVIILTLKRVIIISWSC